MNIGRVLFLSRMLRVVKRELLLRSSFATVMLNGHMVSPVTISTTTQQSLCLLSSDLTFSKDLELTILSSHHV